MFSLIISTVVVAVLLLHPSRSDFVPASGKALHFNGDRAHRHYVTLSPKCQADGNPFDIVNVTLSTWFRTSTVTNIEQTLFGYSFAGGPMIGLQRDGSAHFLGIPVLPSTCWVYMDQTVNLIDGQWHHLAMSAGPSFFSVYVDGRTSINCTGDMVNIPRSDTIVLGVYDIALDSANAQAFTGDMDDIRLYNRLFFTEQDVYDSITSRPPTDEELDQDLVVWFSFDGDEISNEAHISSIIELGGGLLQRSAQIVPSTAPLYTSQFNGTLYIESIQDSISGYLPSIQYNLLTCTPRYAVNCTDQTAVNIQIHQVTSSISNPGTISINNEAVTSGLVLNSVIDPWIVYQPVLGSLADAIYTIDAQFTIAGWDQYVQIVIDSRSNRRPIAGGAGNAAQFDGVDDFYMAEHLAWPTKNITLNGVVRRGLSAITVEFWAWVDESSAGDTALFALGGNTEQYQGWVDQFNRYRKSGRWHITLPDNIGTTVFHAGDATYSMPTKPYYSGWAHYAFVHDGIEGTNIAMYMNGDLIYSGTHDHNGMQDTQLDYNHMTIGTWTFWSEVYHKGIIDEFRLWNYSRTGPEIQRDQYHQLTGSEPNLFAYWSFDSVDKKDTVLDRTGHGNDLRAGGCVSCEPRFYCQPYSPGPITLGPDNCIPSAKSTDSLYYRTQTCYGGTICFRGDERASTHPALVLSGAPIGGHNFPQYASGGDPAEFQLNGTDPDGDPLIFYIESIPERGVLQYNSANGGDWITINVASYQLPAGVSTLRLLSQVGDGGYPFAVVSYSVSDGMVKSVPADISINLWCPRGTYLNPATYSCITCPAGTYSTDDNMQTSCTPCSINEFQPNSGQTTCRKCTPGLNYAATPGSASCTTCNSTSDILNPNTLSLSTSYCALNFITDNEISVHGGHQSDIDFSTLLPDDIAAEQARVVLVTIPQYGRLYQLDSQNQIGDNFNDYFYTSQEIHEQYAVEVIQCTAWLPDRSYNATLGPPDVPRSGSSARAWAAYDTDNGIAEITLRYENALYMTGIIISENIGGGAVTKIEALQPSGQFTTIWTGDPLPVGLLSSRQFQPNICPTNFLTETLRITVNALKCAGRNEIDAVMMMGSTELKKTSTMLVENAGLRVGYQAPTIKSIPGGVPLGYVFTDSISYKIQSCLGGNIITTGVQSLRVTLGSQSIRDLVASRASTTAASVLALIGIVACLLSALFIYWFRTEPIIRASSVFFMNIMLLGLACGFLVLLLTAINAADPSRIPHFCMVRPFLFSIGFVLVMGSIIVKTGRIVFIFELAKGSRVVKVTNLRLLSIVLLMMMIDFSMLIATLIIDPLKDTIVSTDTARYHACKSEMADMLIVGSTAYKGILVLLGLGLVIAGRNVPSTFNEVKALSFMAYTIATNAVIYLIINSLVTDDPNAAVIIMTFTICVALFSIWAILVAFKFFIVLFRPEMNVVNTTRDTKSSHTGGTNSRPGGTGRISRPGAISRPAEKDSGVYNTEDNRVIGRN